MVKRFCWNLSQFTMYLFYHTFHYIAVSFTYHLNPSHSIISNTNIEKNVQFIILAMWEIYNCVYTSFRHFWVIIMTNSETNKKIFKKNIKDRIQDDVLSISSSLKWICKLNTKTAANGFSGKSKRTFMGLCTHSQQTSSVYFNSNG